MQHWWNTRLRIYLQPLAIIGARDLYAAVQAD